MFKIFGFLLVIISIAISTNSYKKFNTFHKGKIVEVNVIEIPVTCNIRNKSLKAYFRFSYKGKNYTKNIKGKYCDILQVNKKVKLKTNQENTIFVYPDENPIKQYLSLILLFLVGIFFIIKNNKNE